MTRFIAILGKGGVGKTTVSVNLAVSLKNLGKDVVLIDCNPSNPDIGLYLNVGKLPVTLSQVFNQSKSIFESIYLHSSGIKLIPSEGLENISMSRLKTIFNTLNGTAEIVLLDTGVFEEEILDLVDEILIVANTDEMSVKHASRIKEKAEEKEVTVLGTVLNKFNNYGLSMFEIEKKLEMPNLVSIEESNDIKTASLNNQAIVNYYPRNDVSKGFNILAEKIGGEFIKKESFFDYLFGLK